MSRKRAREEPCFICSHWHNYEAGEPCSVCGHGPAAESAVSHGTPIPTEVLRDFLFLGSYDQASRCELLRAMGIKRILNVRAAAARLRVANGARLRAPVRATSSRRPAADRAREREPLP